MSPVLALERLGGVASRRSLSRLVERADLDRALRAGDVVRDARGRYALPVADEGLRAANRLSGTLSHRSAALAWGWGLKAAPTRPEVTLPVNRKLGEGRAVEVVLHRSQLTAAEIDGIVTSRERTLVDCLRTLPPEEALAIADSAIRAGDTTEESLIRLAHSLRGPGRVQAVRIAGLASGLAANPFESVLRYLAILAGLSVRAQVPLFGAEFLGRPDLADVERRLILEADSFEWHGKRSRLRADARRYNAFVVHGWTVLRFSWEDVMHDPDSVLATLRAVAQERSYCPRCGTLPA